MGWASGSEVMSEFISALNNEGVSYGQRERVYKAIIPVMQDRDWDTEMECVGEDKAYDAALKELHPDWFEEKDDGDDGD
jgi:hypothetical protein